jgi:hypothetical protein
MYGVFSASLLSLRPAFRWVSRDILPETPSASSSEMLHRLPVVSVDKTGIRCPGSFATVQLGRSYAVGCFN